MGPIVIFEVLLYQYIYTVEGFELLPIQKVQKTKLIHTNLNSGGRILELFSTTYFNTNSIHECWLIIHTKKLFCVPISPQFIQVARIFQGTTINDYMHMPCTCTFELCPNTVHQFVSLLLPYSHCRCEHLISHLYT